MNGRLTPSLLVVASTVGISITLLISLFFEKEAEESPTEGLRTIERFRIEDPNSQEDYERKRKVISIE